jgi:hypothetical protein
MAGCMQMLDVEYYHALAGAGIQYFVVEVMEVAYVERSVYLSFRPSPGHTPEGIPPAPALVRVGMT